MPAEIDRIENLLSFSQLGLHLAKPWRVVVAGPTNVGKSSLINALTGYQRAIVLDQPGTTRDVVTATTAFAGWPIELCDTAGLRATADELESAGVQRANQQAAAADCLVLVFDISQPWNSELQKLVDAWPQAIVVMNKCDLLPAKSDLHGEIPDVVRISAISGQGIDELIKAIISRLIPVEPYPGQALPFTADQIAGLQQAATALRAQNIAAARESLLALLASPVSGNSIAV